MRPRSGTPIDLPVADAALMGALLAAPGIIHVAMAPSHLVSSTLEGWGFLVSGWAQLALAVGVVAAARRWLLWAAVATNVALVAVWAISRTQGLPFGAHQDHPEVVSWVDGATVAFEVLLVGLALLALLRPGAFALKGGAYAVGVPLAVFAVATAVLVTPGARDHSAASHGDHDGEMTAGHDHSATTGGKTDDKGLSQLDNGHQHGTGDVELDDETQALLATQLAGTAQLVQKYPNIAAAEAAGYRRQGPFTPGLGSHYLGADVPLPSGSFDPVADIGSPLLIFDGTEPESPLAGFMYYMVGDQVPEGFAGPNDHWHHHERVCVVVHPDGSSDAPFGADDETVDEAMCDDVGGRWMAITGSMLHVWTVPGYESERGVFSDINPAITCPDGTYYAIPAREYGDRESTCRNP